MSIKITPQLLGRELRARIRKTPQIIDRGVHRGALSGKAILQLRTPTGVGAPHMKARWDLRRGRGGAPGNWEIVNDAPYAGVVEAGARPHPVNEEGLAALTRWARLKLMLPPKEAREVANAIAWKIRRYGQKATYFVRDSRGDMTELLVREIVREIQAFADKPAGVV